MITGTGRLGRAVLAGLPVESRPAVCPGDVRPGVLHLGLGAFHRAHQAVYTEDAIAAAGGDWAIVGVAPRSRGIIDRLAGQDGLYSVLTLAPERTGLRVVGVHASLLHAAGDPLAVLDRIADPAIRVVTLTVTEKGYHLDPATGRLRPDPEVLADLRTGRPPRTVPGLLARGLLARRRAGGAGLAVVCCDNLPDNGAAVRRMVTRALRLSGRRTAGPALDWLADTVSFPGTTVDRIVPASTAATYARAAAALGVADRAAVAAEPYRQWVIEDDFPAGRPAWHRAGAVLTGSVAPWERMKLRVLNGLHSSLAYLGALAGADTIDHTLALPGMRRFLRCLVADDVAPTLAEPPGVSAVAYGETALDRFANPHLRHLTLQVAMDGSQKLRQRLLGTIADRRRAGAHPRWAALSLAAWMRFVRGYADDGSLLPLDDPLADTLRGAVLDAPDTPDGLAAALFGCAAVFGPELRDDAELRRLVAGWLHDLHRFGAAATLAGIAP